MLKDEIRKKKVITHNDKKKIRVRKALIRGIKIFNLRF
jgi:hypothetical protein